MVCNHQPLKEEKYRIRLTIGGDKLMYDDKMASPAANLLETKLLINSTISDVFRGVRFMGIDIKDFFLQTPLPPGECEYMWVHVKYFDEELKRLYNIDAIAADDRYAYCEIKKGMCRLKQAAILAYKQLRERLQQHSYSPIPNSNGLWKHCIRRTIFALCVDNFGIKYFKTEDANHLISVLHEFYDISINWKDKNYCGLTFDWNYALGFVDVSMPGYVMKALEKFRHAKPKFPQFAPHCWNQPAYGQKVQYAATSDASDKLDKKGHRLIQSIIGTFLYYARAVDPTILVALNDLGTQQSAPTVKTKKGAEWLMDFMHTYPDA
eukprot:9461674-Ditylum_brightwellii.AAC.1